MKVKWVLIVFTYYGTLTLKDTYYHFSEKREKKQQL
jgi:hypothetical protein